MPKNKESNGGHYHRKTASKKGKSYPEKSVQRSTRYSLEKMRPIYCTYGSVACSAAMTASDGRTAE